MTTQPNETAENREYRETSLPDRREGESINFWTILHGARIKAESAG
jgi:hypothetical protein